MKFSTIFVLFSHLLVCAGSAQDVPAEIERAGKFGREASSHLLCDEIIPYWSGDGAKLAFRIDTAHDEHRFFQIDLKSGAKSPAFDHEALAKALAKATNRNIRGNALPLESVESDPESGVVRFRAFGKGWRYEAATNLVSPENMPLKPASLLAPEDAMRAARRYSGPTDLTIKNDTAGEIEIFWLEGRNQLRSYGKILPDQSATQSTYGGHVWIMKDASGTPLAGAVAQDTPSSVSVTGRIAPSPQPRDDLSPDGKWRAFIRGHNLAIEPIAGGNTIELSTDGAPDAHFAGPIQWSPDSKKLSAWFVREVRSRQVHIVQSSPENQLQPKLKTIDYPKPGDEIRQRKPRLFDIGKGAEIPIDDKLFETPWSIDELDWNKDSSEFSFLYNQRGHQLMRIVGVRADSGSTRTIFEDRSKTFIDYSQKTWLHRLPLTGELIWASERDGFNHLYLIDAASGRIKQQITSGQWNVREVMEVDAENRQLLLKVIGMPQQDPYHLHCIRINFDGSGLTRLTAGDGNHGIVFSPDRKWIIDKWSRVDLPPVMEIRNAQTGKLLAELGRTEDSELQKTGWSRPERFTAKARDGKTDIYGIIIRPTHFDPLKKYPVVEEIYAGPHDYFVPKNYMPWSGMNTMAELGFIVVKIDGMGTNWRSKAFHDVCWKNLKDSGFPDRIAWIKAAAETRPWMDLGRGGIYGGSAGGQSTLAGLLHHGDFYKVGVADCGCHDNRMDKIWWNEAWMGWPVDESYEQSSNVFHASKLSGKLMLVVGELDTNVDPASTAQVVAALQKAGKTFDFLPIMNAGHGAAETPYGKYRRAEFLVRHLRQ